VKACATCGEPVTGKVGDVVTLACPAGSGPAKAYCQDHAPRPPREETIAKMRWCVDEERRRQLAIQEAKRPSQWLTLNEVRRRSAA